MKNILKALGIAAVIPCKVEKDEETGAKTCQSRHSSLRFAHGEGTNISVDALGGVIHTAKRQLACLLAALALIASLSPACGAEAGPDLTGSFPVLRTYEGFSDVDEAAWYAPYVQICYETGLMEGVGGGCFSPDSTLTDMECLTLLLRAYDLRRGGDGSLEPLPEDWGKLALTTADGRTISGTIGNTNGEPFDFYSFKRDGNADAHLCFDVGEEEWEWAKGVDGQTATLTISGKDYTGTTRFWEPSGFWVLSFYEDSEEGRCAITALYRDFAVSPGPGDWWSSAIYTTMAWGLHGSDTPALSVLATSTPGVTTSLRDFAPALSEAAGELEQINQITQLSGTDDPDVLRLYQAGILTGEDKYGTFDRLGTLTRAQAAAVLARLARPELRVKFTPEPLPARTTPDAAG